MDTYLALAETVLRRARKPLSALQILRIAYTEGLAPPHLRGRTPHKTLQARLSEDILRYRTASRFYRTGPGKFLLLELLHDPLIPEGHRRPIVARRRRRDLPKDRALSFPEATLRRTTKGASTIKPSMIKRLLANGWFRYARDSKQTKLDDVLVWSFVLLFRGEKVLSYRRGSYREDRDTFVAKRSLGFSTPVGEDDLTLFDRPDHGIVAAGIRTLSTDLNIEDRATWQFFADTSHLTTFIHPIEQSLSSDILAIVSVQCPPGLEPTTNRLAINDLQWIDFHCQNNLDDFDPWSQAILYEAEKIAPHRGTFRCDQGHGEEGGLVMRKYASSS